MPEPDGRRILAWRLETKEFEHVDLDGAISTHFDRLALSRLGWGAFRLWEERVPPTVIFEVTSAKTQYEDQVEKPAIYAKLGVREYFLFDAEGVFLRPRLKGFRLEHGTYVPLKLDNAERMVSDELGLQLAIDGPLLRLTDLRTGNRRPTLQELAEKASKAENAKNRAGKATRRAEEAAADEQREVEAQRKRVAELEAELARLRETQTPPGSH